jgi:hypothetical protein
MKHARSAASIKDIRHHSDLFICFRREFGGRGIVEMSFDPHLAVVNPPSPTDPSFNAAIRIRSPKLAAPESFQKIDDWENLNLIYDPAPALKADTDIALELFFLGKGLQ